MQNIITKYENYISKLPKRIKQSKFKTETFIDKLGLTKATFYRKMKENRFTVNEVKQIASVLDLEKFVDKKLAQSENDILEGNVFTKEEVFS